MNTLKQLTKPRYGLKSALMKCCPGLVSIHSAPENTVEIHSPEQEVVIALGSNVGNRLGNFNEALEMMKKLGVSITRHGCLYETEPAYVTDQPYFLNSAVRGFTKLGPHELLTVLKKIEKDLGRTKGVRYGPRPIDLDILFYGRFRINSENLVVPHESIWERPFVMAPLVDVLGLLIENDTVACWHSLSAHPDGIFECWKKLGGESLVGKDGMKRVMPIGDRLWDWSNKTHVMGVLNLTPDSFSDGGKFQSPEAAVAQARLMISQGAEIIDLGAQSTRPMATKISPEEELDRLIPILEAILKMPEMDSNKFISVDTFYSEVAREAVSRGAHIVNDVSGGRLDPKMMSVIANLQAPYIAMHMRGEPTTMQSPENLKYDDNVCEEVGLEIYDRVREAELSGVRSWNIMIDPGIGFSKDTEQNLDILNGLWNIRETIGRKSLGVSQAPMLIGPSRKRFLGDICGRGSAVERDAATIAAVTCGVLGGANIVRVHNVGDNVDAIKLCDAMRRRRMRLRSGQC